MHALTYHQARQRRVSRFEQSVYGSEADKRAQAYATPTPTPTDGHNACIAGSSIGLSCASK